MIRGQWSLNGAAISGFASDDERSAPLWLELLADGEIMGIALATLTEPDNCGFFFPLAPALLEEKPDLQVRVANTTICLPFQESGDAFDQTGLSGEIFLDRGLCITGWALDAAKPERKLRVMAEIEGEKVAECMAGARYLRLASADGHGFCLELPQKFADGQRYLAHIRDEEGRSVPGSPVRICCLPQNAAQWFNVQKKIDKPVREVVEDLLVSLEERLPGLVHEASYDLWKKAFPVPPVSSRQKARVHAPASLLKGQQGAEVRAGDDFALLPGGASSLHTHALAHMLETLRQHDAGAVFADGENAAGQPIFKPCFDRESFLARDYLGPVLVKRQHVIMRNGQADRFATIMNVAANASIAHLPLLLSRCGADGGEDRTGAITAWLQDNCPGAACENGFPRYAAQRKPRISIIIPTRDHGEMLERCLSSLQKTQWPDYELLIVDNGTVEEHALAVLAKASQKANVQVLPRPGVFNYSALNNDAARYASGELLCFLNNDTEIMDGAWLGEMAALLLMAGADGGAAGAQLLWPNGLVQHGGVVVGTHQLAAHVGNMWLYDEPGYMERNMYAQRYSVVTAACLLTPRRLFLESGGFDERLFPIAFNDVDYCLRIGAMGKKIFWTPRARLLHHESASRGQDKAGSAKARANREMRNFRNKWGHYEDPFYNPNLPLSASAEPFMGLAFPPRDRRARLGA